MVKRLVIGLAVLAVGLTPVAAAPQLLFHWDRESGTSRAVVQNAYGEVLAEALWDGALPRFYGSEEEEAEVPIFLLAQLRDQVQQSVQFDAAEALDFIRDLMETHASTPAVELPPELGVWIPYSTLAVEEWCGTWVNTYGECTEASNAVVGTTLCQGLACKATRIEPAQ